jgi:hypothetical protein
VWELRAKCLISDAFAVAAPTEQSTADLLYIVPLNVDFRIDREPCDLLAFLSICNPGLVAVHLEAI